MAVTCQLTVRLELLSISSIKYQRQSSQTGRASLRLECNAELSGASDLELCWRQDELLGDGGSRIHCRVPISLSAETVRLKEKAIPRNTWRENGCGSVITRKSAKYDWFDGEAGVGEGGGGGNGK